jgi:hypothetical protein
MRPYERLRRGYQHNEPPPRRIGIIALICLVYGYVERFNLVALAIVIAIICTIYSLVERYGSPL